MKKEISQIDIKHLELLRENVIRFIKLCASQYDTDGSVLLDVAPQIHEGANPFFKKANIETLDIDANANTTYIADITKKNDDTIKDAYFDMVLCTEVLEHTLNPFKAVAEISRILKVGGKAFITVPFNFRVHGPLPDCWRITEHGLRALFNEEQSFKILQLDALEDEERFLMPIHYTLIAEKL